MSGKSYLQPDVLSPARAIGLPLMNTPLLPEMVLPPHSVLPPTTAAGLPLM